MYEAGGSQFAVDVVELILISGHDMQLDRRVLAVGALALIDTIIVDRRVFLDDIDDFVLIAHTRVADHLNRVIHVGEFDLWRLYFGIAHGVLAS